jgi:hypothetical protein
MLSFERRRVLLVMMDGVITSEMVMGRVGECQMNGMYWWRFALLLRIPRGAPPVGAVSYLS